jgi:hypothetical protein
MEEHEGSDDQVKEELGSGMRHREDTEQPNGPMMQRRNTGQVQTDRRGTVENASLRPIDFLVCWVSNSSKRSVLPVHVHMSALCNHRQHLKILECPLCYGSSTIDCTSLEPFQYVNPQAKYLKLGLVLFWFGLV